MNGRDDTAAIVAMLGRATPLNIGWLPCPTGRLVACDPFFCAGALPLAGVAPTGEHVVVLYRIAVPGWGRRVAAASLLWRQGPICGIEATAMPDGSRARHFVDSGLSSFMDEATRPRFAAALGAHARSAIDANYYWDVLEAGFRASADDPTDPEQAGDWCLHAFADDTAARVAMFSSGLGDGTYSTWWALDGLGGRIGLLTNFEVFTRAEKPPPNVETPP